VHALTVQYYEVPQIYRTSVGLHRIEPCLFVTIKPIDFPAAAARGAVASGDIVVRRCRNALLGAALDQQTRSLLDAQAPESTTVEIRPTVQRCGSSAGVGRLRELRVLLVEVTGDLAAWPRAHGELGGGHRPTRIG
jgi:hypothetical protein